MRLKRILHKLSFAVLMLSISTMSTASITTTSNQEKTEQQIKKTDKQQDRLHKKINKIQKRIIKAKEKAGESVLDEDGFLEDSDDRVRFGLIGVAGGIILSLILSSAFSWIGTLAIIAGLGLLIWYLIEP